MAATIFIVDDDDATRGGLTELLRHAGYAPRPFSTFAAARDALESERPDLLISDLRLNGFNGLQLIALSPHPVPAIVVTGYPDRVLEGEARRLGAEYLVKPVMPAMLLRLVQQRLAAHDGRAGGRTLHRDDGEGFLILQGGGAGTAGDGANGDGTDRHRGLGYRVHEHAVNGRGGIRPHSAASVSVASGGGGYASMRRWERKPLSQALTACIDERGARVLDVSYGGIRFETPADPQAPLLPSLRLMLPWPQLSLDVELVWASRHESGVWLCGGSVIDDTDPRWRSVVDALR